MNQKNNSIDDPAFIMQVIRDKEYWIKIGEIIECKLYGFSERYSATFLKGNEVVQIPGWLATIIKELHDQI
jgi:hypothetical protein